MELAESKANIAEPAKPLALPSPLKGELRIEQLSFAYDEAQQCLRISISIFNR